MNARLILDLDGTITHYPGFFSMLSKLWRDSGNKVVIMTSRGSMWRKYIRRDLKRYGIQFDQLIVHPEEKTPLCAESRRWKKETLKGLAPAIWFDDDLPAEPPEGVTKVLVS